MSENTEMIVVDEPAEQMVQIPVRQYAELIMAIQKLNDIKKIARVHTAYDNGCWTIVEAIKEITEC